MANDTPSLVRLAPRLPTLLCCVGSAKGSAGGPNPNSSSGTFKGYVGMANDTPALVCLVPRLPTSLCVGSAKGSALADNTLASTTFCDFAGVSATDSGRSNPVFGVCGCCDGGGGGVTNGF